MVLAEKMLLLGVVLAVLCRYDALAQTNNESPTTTTTVTTTTSYSSCGKHSDCETDEYCAIISGTQRCEKINVCHFLSNSVDGNCPLLNGTCTDASRTGFTQGGKMLTCSKLSNMCVHSEYGGRIRAECPSTCGVGCCTLSPCRNRGKCHDTSNGRYRCKCRRGWTGTNCEIADSCTSHEDCSEDDYCAIIDDRQQCNPANRCHVLGNSVDDKCAALNGTCADTAWPTFNIGTRHATCTELFKYCSSADLKLVVRAECPLTCGVGCCSLLPCQNRGKCQDTSRGRYKCECQKGWAGTNCEIAVSQAAVSTTVTTTTTTVEKVLTTASSTTPDSDTKSGIDTKPDFDTVSATNSRTYSVVYLTIVVMIFGLGCNLQ